MTTVTLKFNENSKSGKFIKKLLEAIASFSDVKISKEEKSPYKKDFVEEVNQILKNDTFKKLDLDKL